jgi:hypothetical protein
MSKGNSATIYVYFLVIYVQLAYAVYKHRCKGFVDLRQVNQSYFKNDLISRTSLEQVDIAFADTYSL